MGSSLRQCSLPAPAFNALHCIGGDPPQRLLPLAGSAPTRTHAGHDEIEPCQNKLLEKKHVNNLHIFYVIWLLSKYSLFFLETKVTNGTGVLLNLVCQQKKARSRRLNQETHINRLFPSCHLSEYRLPPVPPVPPALGWSAV